MHSPTAIHSNFNYIAAIQSIFQMKVGFWSSYGCWLRHVMPRRIWVTRIVLKSNLKKTPADTTRVLLLCDMAYSYRYVNVDSSNYYATKALKLSQQLNYQEGWLGLIY